MPARISLWMASRTCPSTTAARGCSRSTWSATRHAPPKRATRRRSRPNPTRCARAENTSTLLPPLLLSLTSPATSRETRLSAPSRGGARGQLVEIALERRDARTGLSDDLFSVGDLKRELLAALAALHASLAPPEPTAAAPRAAAAATRLMLVARVEAARDAAALGADEAAGYRRNPSPPSGFSLRREVRI